MLCILSVQIIPCSADRLPACLSGAARICIIPSLRKMNPSGCHRSASGQVIPYAIDLLPLFFTHPVRILCILCVQIIPCSADQLPASLPCAVSSEIIPSFRLPQPVLRHRSAIHQIVPCSVDLLPFVLAHQPGILCILPIQIVPYVSKQ